MTRAHDILRIVRHVYGGNGPLPLHAPVFAGNERAYVESTIESTFVSSVGEYVDQFERMLVALTGAQHVIATTNGTTALHMALLLADVEPGDLVITQSLSFVATANAIAHASAVPAFVDVDLATLGMSPDALRAFLERECERTNGSVRHRASGRRVAACVPMHSFGFPCRIDEIAEVCEAWRIALVEDAAEALGSWRGTRHCGTTGRLGTLSFNGNKVCTTGGGGAIMTNDPAIAKRAKHLTTTAKVPHRWRFEHDAIGYNFRLPNLNAALGCAQLEQLDDFLRFKRALAQRYRAAFTASDIPFVAEPEGTRANYWLCAILLRNEAERDACLEVTNNAGVMTRPAWEPLHTLPMFAQSPRGPLDVTAHVSARLVNIPSGVRTEATT
ncbi:LegC family aminotransferase [Trinickia violacea]|uniref:LegC family aminotransferase n=1 Tax=Trinickia violacea TaxID=2571746 RepID=A0A4P8J476_9BURK|nr:LegC family aminotransferase [Trinickia violacea]QCP53489.1 LegC family aminotransferase [Trinickia violacea]